jgi:hypothetical protein
MNVSPISSPLPGEHVAETWPPMKPETDAGWLQRLNFWPGRALTADALDLEQNNRAGRLAWRGRVVTPGIVTGLAVALEMPTVVPDPLTRAQHFVHLFPGHGIAVTGEDLVVPRSLRIALDSIPVHSLDIPPGGAPPAGGKIETLSLGDISLTVATFDPAFVPWAAFLVLSPAELGEFGKIDPTDPCELDPSRDAFADERRLDAARLRLIQLSAELQNDSRLGSPGDLRWRNRLAYLLFRTESAGSPRQSIRFLTLAPAGTRWDTLVAAATVLPWEVLGVPLALLSSEAIAGTNQRRFFLDRASVARPGGRARARSRPTVRFATGVTASSLNPPGSGTPLLWRARSDQFAEHLGTLGTTDPTAEARNFQFLPPAGVLPRSALNFLTTAQANALSTAPDGSSPDRVAASPFFPSTFPIEAVPVPIEDLDAALASSAPLDEFDLAGSVPETVRMLVPLPQRLFDPQVLVVEQEDPIFAAEVARLVGVRQDWRQRRDRVRSERDGLDAFVSGPQPPSVTPPIEPGQLEPEPVETVDDAFALLSPGTGTGPWELSVNFDGGHNVGPNTILFVELRLDLEALPGRIEVRWRRGAEEFSFEWTEAPPVPAAGIRPDGLPLPTPLWMRFTVTGEKVGATSGQLTGFTLRLDDGRAAIRAVGELASVGPHPVEPTPQAWWSAVNPVPVPQFTGGDWVKIEGDQLRAPFESAFTPILSDGTTAVTRLQDLDKQLNLSGDNSVLKTGLERLIRNLEMQLNHADDTVDLGFLTAQANIHRIRQVLLGEDAANQLLTSPALSSIVEAKSAQVTQEALIEAFKGAAPAAAVAAPTPALEAEPSGAGPAPVAVARGFLPALAISKLGVIRLANGGQVSPALPRAAQRKVSPILAAPPTISDVRASEPAIGQGFELRTLTIAKRFDAGPTRTAFEFTNAHARETLRHVTDLQLGFDDTDTIPDAKDENGQPVSFGRLASEGNTLLDKLQLPQIAGTDDGSAILAHGVRRADLTTYILRRFEFYIARRRQQLDRAHEALFAVQNQVTAANARLLTLENRLAEARHDVSVARALRQEEQQRVATVNDHRDTLIRDEVKFLAYVKPRAVDPVRRDAPGWRLESADVPAPIPACLKEHDEPPDPLRAYIQLFRDAPARWFTAIGPRLKELNTRGKLIELLTATQRSALQFASDRRIAFVTQSVAEAPRTVLQSSFSIIEASRTQAAGIQQLRADLSSWADLRRQAEQFASLGDIIEGSHGQPALSRAAAQELESIEQVATCLHAEFAAVPPAIRLVWVERYSQFDQPLPLNDLSALPLYGRLLQPDRKRLQAFVNWLFDQVTRQDQDAFNLVNDLVRILLLLASHAPVMNLIAGHLPKPVVVRPGTLIPVRPFDPGLVRVGMEFHVWQANQIVASGHVENLSEVEVSARVHRVQGTTTPIDPSMRVQFIAPALSFTRRVGLG